MATFGFSPVGGAGDLDVADAIEVTIDHDGTLSHLLVVLSFENRSELAFFGELLASGDAFATPYRTTLVKNDPGQYVFSLEREEDGGWREAFELSVYALEAGAWELVGEVYSVAFVPEPEDPGAPPEMSNVLPAPGTPIDATTPVSVDVTDDSGLLRRVLLAVELVGQTELAWDGEQWLGHYAGGGSTREPIAGGFRFTVIRDGGWSSSPTLRVFAVDRAGNEA